MIVGWLAIVIAIGVASLAVAALFARSVFLAGAGSNAMQTIACDIREGAHAFLKRQYRTVAVLAVTMAVLIFVLHVVNDTPRLAVRMGAGLLVGAACSAAAGYWAMFVSLRANVRVASAAGASMKDALAVAVHGGAAAGLAIVATSLLGVATLFVLFGGVSAPTSVPYELVGFAFGASFVALFAQLGGGIYTKAADVGADLVGKVEKGIPEDDPRNPAVIADLVGDNVGDCAGRGADLFESASAENIGAMILGVALFSRFGAAGVLFPLVASAFGLVASMVGVVVVRSRREGEDPISAITRGYFATTVVAAGGLFVAVRFLLRGGLWLFLAAAIGLLASFSFAWLARIYTSARHRAVRSIAESSVTGAATNVIEGLAVAFRCTALPVLAISIALLGSYYCGVRGMPGVSNAGLYGTAVATMGMLSTVGYVLSIDIFGPITDNAGGIVEMSSQPAGVRERTDRLDSVGNTTKALTKGYAIGSAALAAFLLFSAYLEKVGIEHVDIGKLPVFIAGLLGAMVVFLFSALAIRAVVRDANEVIKEVRRQFHDVPGLMEGSAQPDFGRCVDMVTAAALRGMIAPGLLAVGAPIAVGLLFGFFAPATDPTLGAECVAAVLMVGTIAGVLLALMMNTGGGAWDNAKKLIESGALGGKRSEAHKAAVVGDAVGDPLKDTAGPSLHVLIKLLGTVALVTAPLFV